MFSQIVDSKNVIVFGAIPSLNPRNKQIFETVNLCCKKKNLSTYTPLDLVGMKLENKHFFSQILQAILKCDFIIADISSTQHDINLGIGIFLGTANQFHKSIIILAKSQTTISKTLLGMPNVVKVIFYENIQDLASKLDEYLTYGKFKK